MAKIKFNYSYSYKYIIIILLILLKMSSSFIIKPNILFICVDDLRYLTETEINMPNIQRLAAKSINFKTAFAQQALCAPSRNSILTGRRPDSLKLYDFYSYWRQAAGNFTTFPQYFKENGYETFSVGKIFHPGISSNFTDDYPYSWSRKPYHPPTEIYKDAPVCEDQITMQLQSNLICPVKVLDQPGKSLPDLQSLNFAKKIIARKSMAKTPYLLAVGFHKPHLPIKFPLEYLDKIPLSKVKPPKFPNKPKDLPLVAWHPWTDVHKRDDIKSLNLSFPFGRMPTAWTIKIRQSYYAAARYIDDLVGELIRSINLDNTIVVLTSDHGWSLGENGLWAKYSNFDVALKVPLIISVPGLYPKSVSTPVELVDIFPTLVDLIGHHDKIPKCRGTKDLMLCFDGESLFPLMKSNYFYQRSNVYAISQYPRPRVYPQSNSDKPCLKDITIMGYSIRTKRFRYTEWISFNNTIFTRNWKKTYGLELYDHFLDPNEAYNLFSNPKYKIIMRQLSKLLKSKVSLYN